MDEALRQLRELLHPKRTNCVPIRRFFPHRPADAIDSGNDSVKRQSSVIQPERGGHARPLQKELSNNRWIRVSGAPGNVDKEREYERWNSDNPLLAGIIGHGTCPLGEDFCVCVLDRPGESCYNPRHIEITL